MARHLVDELITTARSRAPDETGGVLMGYWVEPLKEVVVTDLIGPGPNAGHKATRFEPDTEFQEAEIERLYHASGRVHTYLGDWHSHPGGSSLLSRRDSRTLKTIAKTPEARAPIPIMAIVANKPRWHVRVWRYRPSRRFFSLRESAVCLRLIEYP